MVVLGRFADQVRRTLAAIVSGDKPLIVVLVGTLVLGAVLLSGPTQNFLDSRARVEILQMQADVLEEENARLRQRAADLHDDETIELLAREQQGFVRPGEVPYALIPPEVDRPLIASSREQPEPPPAPWYERAWLGLQRMIGVG